MAGEQNNHKAAYIAAGGAITAALITGVFLILGQSESTSKAPIAASITQTVSGSGVGVINTGSGNANVQHKD